MNKYQYKTKKEAEHAKMEFIKKGIIVKAIRQDGKVWIVYVEDEYMPPKYKTLNFSLEKPKLRIPKGTIIRTSIPLKPKQGKKEK